MNRLNTCSSTPVNHSKSNFRRDLGLSYIVKTKTTKMTDALTKPKTIDMICEAITAIGSEKKGASFQAIKKFVVDKYSNAENTRLQLNLKKAITKGVETGVLDRPSGSKTAKGATGFFVIAKKKPIAKATGTKVTKNPRTKEPTEPVSDSEVTINKGKKGHKLLKRNLSDTEIDIKLQKEKVKKTVPSQKLKDKIKLMKPDNKKILPTEKTITDEVPTKKNAELLKKKPTVTKTISGPTAKKKLEKKESIKEKVTEKKANEKSDKKQPKTASKKKGTN